jgi:DNA modification methylase
MNLSEIHINPSNPRIIKDERFKKLVKSISEFPKMMSLRPIIVDADGMILGGNMRFKALLELGYKEVPDEWVRRADELTEDEKRRFIIEDNLPFGEWDWESLANNWDESELIEWGMDIPDFAFKKEVEEDDYEIPDEIETDIVLGDLFEIGQHRLLCGDSTDSDQVAKLMNGQKADMVFTDPPYGMSLDVSNSDNVGAKDGWKSKPKNYSKVIGDGKDFTPELINTVFACFDYCQEIFIWGADYFAELIPNRKTGSWIVWDKRAGIEDLKLTFSEFELCWSKQKHLREIARIAWSGLLGTEQEFDHKRHHPTQKPIKLSSWFIDKFSNDGDLISDIYLGSGSTMVAAHQLNRKCYGMEIDPKYCQVIVDRMKKLDPNIEIKKNGVLLT